jgi:fructose-1,6-bisphosphatase/inositol monophosphatase family enzyme
MAQLWQQPADLGTRPDRRHRAFITGLPLWGTLIALNDGTRPVIGVMNQPFTGERFVGTPEGAWRSGTPLKPGPAPSFLRPR